MTKKMPSQKRAYSFLLLSFISFASMILLLYGCGGEWRGLKIFGSSGARISLSPSSIDFGSVAVGNALTSTITIHNEGTEDLSISGMSLSDTENYALDTSGGENPSGCLNPLIPPGESRTVSVSFSPYAAYQCSASLKISSDYPGPAEVSVPLTGTGTAKPVIGVSPSNHVFGMIETGTHSEPIEVSITNSGTEYLIVSDIYLTDTDHYSLDVNGGQYPSESTEPAIPPGETRTVTVSFTPGSPGDYEGELHILSNDPVNATSAIVFSGSGDSVIPADRTVSLHWQAPDTNVDGSPATDLAGFKIYIGASSGNYTDSIDVGYLFSYTLLDLPAGTLYFSITAYDTMGNESDFSNEGSKTLN